MRLFETRTTDFDEDEIRTIKEQFGQLYLDVSRKDRLDDFARDLKQLHLAGECGTCAKRTACAGAYVPAAQPAFEGEEARLRALLQSLRGTVLDVGCGHPPYAAWLEAAVVAAKVRYFGIEPDAAVRERFSATCPWATLADDLSAAPPNVDHALFLRSVNHLPQPLATIANVTQRLREGGSLILVDNVAFGLVRSREQAQRAETSSALLEHHRNASAEELRALLTHLPLVLRECQEVTPANSNQWLLHYERLSSC